MDPGYFTHELSFYEAELFCRGLRRRERGAWERARYNAYYSAAPHCKNFRFDDMRKFPWEEEEEDDGMPQRSEKERLEEMQALWEKIKREEREMTEVDKQK
jgi:hypothetical protein